MKLIDGAIELEQVERPGSIGDSFPESARYEHLKQLLGNYKLECNFDQFITPLGYVRHPDVPDDWKEKDTSSDVLTVPFIMFKRMQDPRADEMKKRIKSAGYKTGNGDFVSLGFFAELTESNLLRNCGVLSQIAIFKLPYRWSDSKKWFERTESSSGDYLNFIHVAVYTPKWVRRLINPDQLLQKVRDYYKPEPNSEEVIDLYAKVIKQYWGGEGT